MGSVSVKDTIHGYIDFNDLERRVIATPWIQRLRRVKQNDVSSIVYPTMQATRFEHSLGAMHLAGRCVEAALSRDSSSHSEHVQRFLTALRSEVSDRPSGYKIDEKDVGNFAVAIARMYGLLHDVGHPPYSHLVESVWSSREIGLPSEAGASWHEYNSTQIVTKLLPNDVGRLLPPLSAYDSAVLDGVGYLCSKGDKGSAFHAIKELVDSVIDVDRMDFVARDGRTSGSEFGSYDMNRLVQSFSVHVEPPDPEVAPTRIFIRPSDKALSAIESLLQERYKIYRWVHFHHRVMQSKALARHALRGLKHVDALRLSAMQKCLRSSSYVSLRDKAAGYVLLGDGWIDAALDTALADLNQRHTADGSLPNPEPMRTWMALRGLVLREKLGIPLWKRADGYTTGVRYFERILLEQFEDPDITDPPRLEFAAQVFGSVSNWLAVTFSSGAGRSFLDEVASIANSDVGEEDDKNLWLLLEACRFSKGKEELERLIVHGRTQRLDYLTRASSVAAGLQTSIKRDVHLFAFAFTESPPADAEIVRVRCRERIARAVVEAFKKRAGFRDALEGQLATSASKEAAALS